MNKQNHNKKPLVARAWTWKIQGANGNWQLCRWATAYRDTLIADGKPSPEARVVCVRMIPI